MADALESGRVPTAQPADLRSRRCLHCGSQLEACRRSYCSDACRSRGFRRRRLGLPENLYAGPTGGLRGRLSLNDFTAAQARLRLLELWQS